MRTIVLGFPRSGTGTLSKVYDVGHEEMTEKGTPDWHLVGNYERQEGDTLIHVVRNPLEVITSNLFTMRTDSLQIMKEITGLPEKRFVQFLIDSWIYFDKKIREYNPDETIKIETIGQIENGRKHPKLTWEDLDLLANTKEIKKIAEEYGY